MSRPLCVGLNLTYLVEDSGGSGRYARELIPAMLELEPDLRITAWTGATAPAQLMREPWAERVRWVRLPVPGVGTPWHLWHELVAIGVDARRRRLDVVHGLANLVPLITPGLARVVTILDVIWVHHPNAMDLRARLAMRTLTPLCGHRADRVIAISRAAAHDICKTLHIRADKVDVTHLGVSPLRPGRPIATDDAMRSHLGLRPGPLVLCLAAKRAHKNLDGLIRALAELAPPRPLLVLPGSPTRYEQELRRLSAELGVGDDVALPGWIEEDQLEALWAAATCFVLPSFQEGFGLPVLEAMARGVPVTCSSTSSLPEVADDAALFFDPADEYSIAARLRTLLEDPELRRDLSVRGLRRAAQFRWRQTAAQTLGSYRTAIERCG